MQRTFLNIHEKMVQAMAYNLLCIKSLMKTEMLMLSLILRSPMFKKHNLRYSDKKRPLPIKRIMTRSRNCQIEFYFKTGSRRQLQKQKENIQGLLCSLLTLIILKISMILMGMKQEMLYSKRWQNVCETA